MEDKQRTALDDANQMTAAEMVEFLRTLEECEVLCNPYHSNPRGFDLYFVPKSFSISMVLHIELVTSWAAAHRHTVVMLYDTFKRAIVVKVNRLFAENTYPPEDILK